MLWPLASSPTPVSPPPEDVPHPPPLAPVLWRAWLKIIRREAVGLTELNQALPIASSSDHAEHILTRAERAHWRLSWDQRLVRNARLSDAPHLVVTLNVLPATFAVSFGFDLPATA